MNSCLKKLPELRRCRPLLGTLVEIHAHGPTRAALAGVEAAFAAITRVQSLLSYHESSSELSRLNREAAHRPVPVDDWTFQVLALAQRIHAASDGCFDPVVAPLLERTGGLPRTPGTSRVAARATFADVILLPRRRVRFARALRLDLGGIAKGFAVDCAIETLRAAGVPTAIVNAGGDLRTFGSRSWPIVMRDPSSPGQLGEMGALRDGALATSAVYFSRRRMADGRWTSAIIHPRTRRPWLARASVTVRATNAATADALTKVLALCGPVGSRAALAAFDAEGWWCRSDGQCEPTQEHACVAA